jgi:hypothetical protein
MPDAQGSVLPEGDDDLSVSMGEEGIVSGGVFDHGTHEEDGPGTWEALCHEHSTAACRCKVRNYRRDEGRYGPSEPGYRVRLQTTSSGSCQKPGS